MSQLKVPEHMEVIQFRRYSKNEEDQRHSSYNENAFIFTVCLMEHICKNSDAFQQHGLRQIRRTKLQVTNYEFTSSQLLPQFNQLNRQTNDLIRKL